MSSSSSWATEFPVLGESFPLAILNLCQDHVKKTVVEQVGLWKERVESHKMAFAELQVKYDAATKLAEDEKRRADALVADHKGVCEKLRKVEEEKKALELEVENKQSVVKDQDTQIVKLHIRYTESVQKAEKERSEKARLQQEIQTMRETIALQEREGSRSEASDVPSSSPSAEKLKLQVQLLTLQASMKDKEVKDLKAKETKYLRELEVLKLRAQGHEMAHLGLESKLKEQTEKIYELQAALDSLHSSNSQAQSSSNGVQQPLQQPSLRQRREQHVSEEVNGEVGGEDEEEEPGSQVAASKHTKPSQPMGLEPIEIGSDDETNYSGSDSEYNPSGSDGDGGVSSKVRSSKKRKSAATSRSWKVTRKTSQRDVLSFKKKLNYKKLKPNDDDRKQSPQVDSPSSSQVSISLSSVSRTVSKENVRGGVAVPLDRILWRPFFHADKSIDMCYYVVQNEDGETCRWASHDELNLPSPHPQRPPARHLKVEDPSSPVSSEDIIRAKTWKPCFCSKVKTDPCQSLYEANSLNLQVTSRCLNDGCVECGTTRFLYLKDVEVHGHLELDTTKKRPRVRTTRCIPEGHFVACVTGAVVEGEMRKRDDDVFSIDPEHRKGLIRVREQLNEVKMCEKSESLFGFLDDSKRTVSDMIEYSRSHNAELDGNGYIWAATKIKAGEYLSVSMDLGSLVVKFDRYKRHFKQFEAKMFLEIFDEEKGKNYTILDYIIDHPEKFPRSVINKYIPLLAESEVFQKKWKKHHSRR